MAAKQIKIGLVGFGTVGSGVWRILSKHRRLLEERVGARLEIARIGVRSRSKKRSPNFPSGILTTDLNAILRDPQIKIVVEVMGDVKASRNLALKAIKAGKHYVTANKALLAMYGKELFTLAAQKKVDICFEAAVGGGIPILRTLREGFVGNEIKSLFGILNGTCNYILTEMAEKGSDFAPTLRRAQALGYAEADPGFDIEGVDAAHKLAILVAIAHGVYVDLKKIHVEGIKNISPLDLECAARFGYAVKLLGIAKNTGGKIQARVHPTMVPAHSMLAAVHGIYNAVFLDGDFVGEEMLYGRGAGSDPTASAVVGDIVEVARNLLAGVGYTVPPLGTHARPIREANVEGIGDLRGLYYLRFQAIDRPGVLADIAKILSRYQISISSVYQHMREEGREVPIVIVTHEAREKNIQQAIARINRLKTIKKPTTLIRIEENLK